MSTATAPAAPPAPGGTVIDALGLLAEVGEELVLATVRDTHLAIAQRAHGLATRGTLGLGALPQAAHLGIARGVYAGIGLGLRGAGRGLDRVAATGHGPALDATRGGRLATAAVNGLIGDRLAERRPELAIPLAVRVGGRDVWPDADELAAAFPAAGPRVAVLVHGLCEDDEVWGDAAPAPAPDAVARPRVRYPEVLRALGWTVVVLRLNTGLPVRENGAALSALLDRLLAHWPVPLERFALIGHSMGGLVIRAASAVRDPARPDGLPAWAGRVGDIVTLATPHHGAPLAWGVGHGSRALARLPETAAFGRILDWRSRGVHDLVVGLGEEVPPLPGVSYRLVSACLTTRRHPVGHALGDLLVRTRSAQAVDRAGRQLFPGAETVHLDHTDHFGVLAHPEVAAHLRRWLA